MPLSHPVTKVLMDAIVLGLELTPLKNEIEIRDSLKKTEHY